MVLTQQRRLLTLLIPLQAVGLAVGFGGCSLFRWVHPPESFSHVRHAAKGITCDACHMDYASGRGAGMPTYRNCLACHGPDPSRDPYPYELEIQSQSPDVLFLSSRPSYDLEMSHAVHHEHEVACETCHAEAGVSHRVTLESSRTPALCLECHRKESVDISCSTCHRTLDRDVRPPSHLAGAWQRTHGREATVLPSWGHAENCSLCHADSFCSGCHRVEQPRDHTAFFRQRSHGYVAAIDRDRCRVCHKESFCIRCHSEARPRSHTAGWGGRTSNHCLFCHLPLGEASCYVCHKSTASHRSAQPVPPPPHPPRTSDCYQCHLRPPHADGGQPCAICHR